MDRYPDDTADEAGESADNPPLARIDRHGYDHESRRYAE